MSIEISNAARSKSKLQVESLYYQVIIVYHILLTSLAPSSKLSLSMLIHVLNSQGNKGAREVNNVWYTMIVSHWARKYGNKKSGHLDLLSENY